MTEENKEINYYDIFDNEFYAGMSEDVYHYDLATIELYAQKAEELVSYEKQYSDLICNCSDDEVKLKIKALLAELLSQIIENHLNVETGDTQSVVKLDDKFDELVEKHLGIKEVQSKRN